MPLQDANDETLDPSANVDQDVDVNLNADGVQVDDNGAVSSDARDVSEEERGTLDVVQDVVKARNPEEASSAEGQKEGEGADPKGTQTAKEQDDENFTDVPFHKHPRFRQVLGRLKTAEPDAERYRNVVNFCDNNGLSAEEASEALITRALLKSDPVAGWAKLKPLVQEVLVAAGEVLDTDLRARVDKGELTEETAREIAKERAGRTSVERQRETDQQRQERKQRTDHTTSIKQAAQDWETERTAKDPNFAAKKQRIFKELAWIHTQEGLGKTPAEVKDQLDRAYKEVGGVGTAVARRATTTKAPLVREATRPAMRSASPSQQPRSEEPTGAMKFIKAAVAARGAAV